MEITEAMAAGYLNAVVNALKGGTWGTVDGPNLEAQDDILIDATIVIPDALSDASERQGLVLNWESEEGPIGLGWSASYYDPVRNRRNMHTDLCLGVVPSPAVLVEAVTAIVADGDLRSGRVVPGTVDLLARYAAPSGSDLTAVCTPNSHPHDDGRVEHGYQINVIALDDNLSTLATIDLPDWESFRPASAGHRLIEAGYMIAPGIDRADMNGWKPVPNSHAYKVPVVPLDADGHPGLGR